jgi:hypothetical protein
MEQMQTQAAEPPRAMEEAEAGAEEEAVSGK